MTRSLGPALTRRTVLSTSAAAALSTGLAPWLRSADATTTESRLAAEPGRARLVPSPHPETAVWAYDGLVPGPEIRVRQGKRLRVTVENRLDEETTVHWHGVRVPNPMDGVPYLTQKPNAPGAIFLYEVPVPSAAPSTEEHPVGEEGGRS